jgi:hypothetical protein
MGNANILPAGGDASADYLAFGDDSQFGDTLVYAFVIVHRDRAPQVRTRLSELKQRFRISASENLHCRVLFSGHQRKKAGLGHLSPQDVRSLIAEAVTIINEGPVLIRFAVGGLPEFERALGNQIEMKHESDGSRTRLPVKLDPKGLLSILLQMCFAVAPDGSNGPTASECKIFASEEKTRVEFIGSKRRRADAMYSGFNDIGAPAGNVFQLIPTVVGPASEPLLQLADIAAYICSHSTDESDENSFFREQRTRFLYWSSGVFSTRPPSPGENAYRVSGIGKSERSGT